MFTINPASGTPIYRQLVEQIRRMVSSGQLRAGDPLPSVRELAMDHAVNPMTISRAYSLLEAEGLLQRQRGKGMFVAERQQSLKQSRQERLQHLQTHIDALVMAASQLELDTEEVVTAVRKNMEKNK